MAFQLPSGWKLATLLNEGKDGFEAPNYDRLADSPAEAGHFQEYDYSQDGATYRVIVYSDSVDYSSKELLALLEKITATETALMHDVPFKRYTFILHFLSTGSGGGMEHAFGTAISMPAANLDQGWGSFANTAAHEFFHLWNVKRIRPQGLEPIDYIHGNDTRDLWFSEGVTSYYAEVVLLRSHLITRKTFYQYFAGQIQQLQRRPARHFQSAELSGREAWLEKYPDYWRPDRSISYYNKGAILGLLLDLAIREGSNNRNSLDDLMRQLNENFAQKHRFFNDADLEALIAKLAPGFRSPTSFFDNYVRGTQELNCNLYLGYAGLKLATRTRERADLGFSTAETFNGLIHVVSVRQGGNAQAAGLEQGDVILKLDDAPLPWRPEFVLAGAKPGQRVNLEIRRGDRILHIQFQLGRSGQPVYRIEKVSPTTPEEIRIRQGWLEGKTEPSANR